ncbi:MAG: hypothetical protein Q7S33_04890 [Nanoarchaeota archaeon]|nr:hypothetical protein [Nanoarchaeota archaeon]
MVKNTKQKGIEDLGNEYPFPSQTSLPHYVKELIDLGRKYNVPIEVDNTEKIIKFSARQAMDSDGRNGFVGAAEDIKTYHLDWDIQYTIKK